MSTSDDPFTSDLISDLLSFLNSLILCLVAVHRQDGDEYAFPCRRIPCPSFKHTSDALTNVPILIDLDLSQGDSFSGLILDQSIQHDH